ncbi:MAG TPA: hypothetical protein VJH94_02275 [Candidatus Paceibacterota bacterium]
MEQAPHNIPTPTQAPIVPEMGVDRNQVQIALALMASREAHPDLGEKELRAVAMKEWVGDPDDPSSLAARFGSYLENPVNTNGHTDIDDPKALRQLLENVRQYRKTPLH